MSLNVELLEASFKAVAPHATRLADLFYTRLFREHPEVRSMFPEDMAGQKKKLIASLATIVGALRKPEELGGYLEELGRRHVAYGALEAHYPVVGENLLHCLAEVAGDAWTAELQAAWSEAYGAIQETMLSGAEATSS